MRQCRPAARRIGTARDRVVFNGAAIRYTDALKSYNGLTDFERQVVDERRGLRADRAPVSPLTAAAAGGDTYL